MKRTTYILIGLIVSGLVVIVTFIVLISVSGQSHQSNGFFVGGDERVEMNLNNVHTVKMFINKDKDSENRWAYVNGDVTVTSPSTAGERKIVYPKNQYLKVSQVNDTLLMELDLSNGNIAAKFRDRGNIYATGMDVQLSVDSLNSLLFYANGLKMNLKKVKMDSLFIYALHQEVLLDSCQFRSFSVDGKDLRFKAKDGKIENFYLNLNSIWRWNFENCEIGTEYLRGSNSHRNSLQVGECKRVVWTPLNEKAQLQVTFRESAEIIVNPK